MDQRKQVNFFSLKCPLSVVRMKKSYHIFEINTVFLVHVKQANFFCIPQVLDSGWLTPSSLVARHRKTPVPSILKVKLGKKNADSEVPLKFVLFLSSLTFPPIGFHQTYNLTEILNWLWRQLVSQGCCENVQSIESLNIFCFYRLVWKYLHFVSFLYSFKFKLWF